MVQKFNVIGISVRTTNENGQSGTDIPALWNQFISEGILSKIPNKVSEDIFCVYTDYEKDHTKPYTTILGCRVENLDTIPNEMVGKTIETAVYEKFITQGNLNDGIVFNKWLEIWDSGLNRSFTADYEVYGDKAQNPQNATVEIFIAVS
ncbi:hypothetical protein Flavo103_19510 [Flavobacterium collinsii]|uniref:GyrI-like domain-containing protein n=1 Tax=Flavobacterium collinsii TaxID=1114861 RepID=UPI0022C29C2D|nr:GyrI-like domain-containing protein [Flavobacterium collinsii]GIQ58815.1 hypothetical protein Flavo103_19510 [Flavobacterium collinsii]